MNNFDRAKENMYKTKLQQLERKLNEADKLTQELKKALVECNDTTEMLKSEIGAITSLKQDVESLKRKAHEHKKIL